MQQNATHTDRQDNDSLNYNEAIESFLKNHSLFRGIDYTWQDIMRLDPELVEWKVRAERFGKKHIIGYDTNNSGKILCEIPEGNRWLQVEFRYDKKFMKTYVEMVKKKIVLMNNEGIYYIEVAQKLREDIKKQYKKGYVAMDFSTLTSIFPLFLELGEAKRLLISESTMRELTTYANHDREENDSYRKCYLQLVEWQRKGKFFSPLKQNTNMVTRKCGFLNLKTLHPSSDDLEISCFIPLANEGADLLYFGRRWLNCNQGHWGVPFYKFMHSLDFDIKLKQIVNDSVEDLIELDTKVVYLPKFPNGHYDYLYHGLY